MKFNYQARDKSGQVQTGVVEASSKETALSVLQKHDLFVTYLEEVKLPIYARQIPLFAKPSRKDLVMFTRQFSIMFKSNVPVVETLETIAYQIRKIDFKEKIFKIAEEVEAGSTLSDALALYPEIFTRFYVSMVRSGEISGKLSESLEFLADYLERENVFMGKIISALVYPAFIVIVFLLIGFLMGTMVVPELTKVLETSQTDLPFITKAVIFGADFLKNYWWLVLAVITAVIVFGGRLLKSPEGRSFMDKNTLHVPMVGPFLKKLYLSRTAMNLSTLISGGLPIAQALEVTAGIVNNEVYRDVIMKAQEAVVAGQTISSSLSNYPDIFSPLFVQMAMVGERTGRLDSSLTNIVNFYQEEVERELEAFVKIFEPLLILILGGLVGGLAAALLLPLYGSIQSF